MDHVALKIYIFPFKPQQFAVMSLRSPQVVVEQSWVRFPEQLRSNRSGRVLQPSTEPTIGPHAVMDDEHSIPFKDS